MWIDEGRVEPEPDGRRGRGTIRRPDPGRGSRPGRRSRTRTDPDKTATPKGADRRRRGSGLAALDAKDRRRLDQAAEAFSEERFGAARHQVSPLVRRWPDVAEVRELAGLIAYRTEAWAAAIAHLEVFERSGGGVEQHPVRADCHRALGQHGRVDELWDELAAASPSAELVSEGRIVAAGSRADQGAMDEAIALLRSAPNPRRVAAHHLRTWYALGDLLERAGEVGAARERFAAVADHDPAFGDVAERLASLT